MSTEINTNHSPKKVARAIDAGFGVIKFSRAATTDEANSATGSVTFDSFMSIALDASVGEADVALARKRDTVTVEYAGQSYEVGKGIEHGLVANDFGRDMTDAYYKSGSYHALMRGALAYMGDPEIDTLVLGLPMNHYENKAQVAALKAAYTGRIELGGGRHVDVKQTLVHPQPFGAYIALGSELDGINAALRQYPQCGIKPLNGVAELAGLNVLIVDPGEFTLDWLVMNKGGYAQRVSSAAGDAGRFRVIREVMVVLEAKLNRPIGASFFADVDRALRNKTPFRIGGQSFDLSTPEYQAVIKKAVEDPVRQLLESLRGADDRIDLIAVLGGSPAEVAAAIRAARPLIPLYCPVEKTGQASTLFANLRGFQVWAEAAAAKSES